MTFTISTVIDLCFHIIGKLIPVDHGFALYGALSCVLPIIHEDEDIRLKLIRGRYTGNGLLDISPSSHLVLRLPASKVSAYLPLAGKSLKVAGFSLRVGIPFIRTLLPAAALYAPLVTTKNGHMRERFEIEIQSQMASLGLKGKLHIGRRRTFQVHGKQVVGYAVLITELNPNDSIRLQQKGLGGRRKMGCGFFEAWNKTWRDFLDEPSYLTGEKP